MKQRLIWGSGLALITLCACATTRPPPPELQNARTEVHRAESGPTAQANPAGVIGARQALDTAEQEYGRKQTSKDVESLGYVAQRDAQIAEADARTATMAKQLSEKQEAAYNRSQRRAKVALGRLGLAAKDDPRGTVITLPTANMFAVNEAKILPSAQGPLTEIAKAVKEVVAEQSPEDVGRRMQLIGYTDSTGTDEHNLDLSKRRAEAVKQFFGQHGLNAANIETDGKGEADPIADNETAKGRAQNRRVEIIITSPSASTANP
jgi:outer membrane protein OmpA-like peptidoglycan-associated protein